MHVDRDKAETAENRDRTFYFCSEQCRQRFEADPDAFVGSSDSGAEPVLTSPR